VLHDAMPSAGPLCGITAAIERASHAHVAVIAIDLPRMTAAWFQTLLADCAPGVGAVGQREGMFEPLAAIYPREMMPSAWEALTVGRYGLQPLLMQAVAKGMMRGREIAADEIGLFENWNEA
jgi:molybdopterin-guanine dinucleotide biosynthesis protein A